MDSPEKDFEEAVSAEQLTLNCICGRTVEVDLLEEYDLPTFVGACVCGRVWSLSEMSNMIETNEE